MAWKEKAKSSLLAITAGCIIGSIPLGIAGVIYTLSKADEALTAEAREMQRLESDSELRQKYSQLNEAYLKLKSDPEVIESINKSEQEWSKMLYWFGVGMGPATIAGVYVILAGSRRRRE